MPKRIEYKKGDKVGNCIYLYDVSPHVTPYGREHRKAMFQCKCGKEFAVIIDSVKAGNTKSCGCLNRIPTYLIHGMTLTGIYQRWQGMKRRCYSDSAKFKLYYQDRGIKVCDEWKGDFIAFHNYVMVLKNAMKPGYSIDRINNDGNYEPGNVKWSTRSEQQNNKGKYRKRIRQTA